MKMSSSSKQNRMEKIQNTEHVFVFLMHMMHKIQFRSSFKCLFHVAPEVKKLNPIQNLVY